jgi:SAM-dependent methyltransferase
LGGVSASTAPPCGHNGSQRHLYDGWDRLCGVPGRFSVLRCGTCRLAYTVPRPDPEELRAYYPDSYASYRESVPATTVRQRLGARVDAARFSAGIRFGAFRRVTRLPPGRLLDVGCGRGDLAEWFAERGWQVAGVEPSEYAAKQAAERGIEVHRGTLDDAPWAPESFDAITFSHVLEHVPDPLTTLRQVLALLRPAGIVAVSLPNFGAWQRRLFGEAWFPLDLPRHLQHFDRVSLPHMARAAGLEPIEVRTSPLFNGGILASVQYALRGRLFLSDATVHRAMHAIYPLLLATDLVLREGDCLHVVARRPA